MPWKVLFGVLFAWCTTADGAPPWKTPDVRFAELDQALASNDFAAAEMALGELRTAAKMSGDRLFQDEVLERFKEVSAHQKQFERLTHSLEIDPNSAEKRAELALFHAAWKHDWDLALPMLRSSPDPAIAEAATADLAEPADPKERVALAERWIKAIPRGADRHVREAFQHRAAHWLRLAIPDLAGPERNQASLKLQKIPLFVDAVVVWNTHNEGYRDRGAEVIAVSLLTIRRPAWKSSSHPITWSPDKESFTVVSVPHVRADAVRVDIEKWHGAGAGLAEIQVIVAGENTAPGMLCEVESYFERKYEFLPATLVDGDRSGNRGSWCADNGKKSWGLVQFNQFPPAK